MTTGTNGVTEMVWKNLSSNFGLCFFNVIHVHTPADERKDDDVSCGNLEEHNNKLLEHE